MPLIPTITGPRLKRIALAGGVVAFVSLIVASEFPRSGESTLQNLLAQYESRIGELAISQIPCDGEVRWRRTGLGARWAIYAHGEIDPEVFRNWAIRNAERYSEEEFGGSTSSPVFESQVVSGKWYSADGVTKRGSAHYGIHVNAKTGLFELWFGPIDW